MTYFSEWMSQRLKTPLPGIESHKKMMSSFRPVINPISSMAKKSGVLALIYPDNTERLHIVFIERTNDGGVHSGQIALPGGKYEKEDKNLIDTALREAQEEINLAPESVEVLGTLTDLYIPVSNFVVKTTIGFSGEIPDLKPSDQEVAAILHVPLASLFQNKGKVQIATPSFPSIKLRTQAYMLEEKKFIWGATAMIVAELEDLWNEYNNQTYFMD